MALTPVDMLHTEFKTRLRGYNKNQVDEFVRTAAESLEVALKDRAELQRKLDALQEEVDQVRQIKATLTEALTVAQKSADDLRAGAHQQAEAIIKEAEVARVQLMAETQAEAEKYRTEISLLQATRDRFEAEFRALLSSYNQWLDKRVPEKPARSEVA